MIDDIYTNPEVIMQQYMLGANEALAVELASDDSASVSLSTTASPSLPSLPGRAGIAGGEIGGDGPYRQPPEPALP